MTEPVVAAPDHRKPWIDLSAYRLKAFLLRSESGGIHLLIGGDTEANTERLLAYGMRQHPKNGLWFRTFAQGERLTFPPIKAAFPLMEVKQVDPSGYLVPMSRSATRTVVEDKPVDAPTAPAVVARPVNAIAPPSAQRGKAERAAATLLASLGLTERIAQIDRNRHFDFHAVVKNPPYMDLVIERLPHPRVDKQGRDLGGEVQRILFTHYRRQNGDSILDAELVFEINPDWTLTAVETATMNPFRGGELRGFDRAFAGVFASNLVSQGFGNGVLVLDDDDAPEASSSGAADDASTDGSVIPATTPVEAATPAAPIVDAASLASIVARLRRVLDSVDSGRLPAVAVGGKNNLKGACDWLDRGDIASALPMLGLASQRLARSFGAQADVIDESIDALRALVKVAPVAAETATDTAVIDGAGDALDRIESVAAEASTAATDTSDAANAADIETAPDAPVAKRERGTGVAVPFVDPDDFASALLDVPQEGRENYRVLDSDMLRKTWNERAVVEINLRALRILRDVEGGREPDGEDLDALIAYTGWGGLPGVFQEGHPLYTSYNAALRAVASADAYAEMRASTLNAHYTHHEVVDALWAAALKAGFTGGRVLEAGAGSGMFLARVPAEVKDETRFVAVEKDETSARLLSVLYPRAKVFHAPYEQTAIPDNSVDLVIGNVPFGGYKIYDPVYKKLQPFVHDYFILKSLDKLRPGGIMMVITGTGTLDRLNPKIREAIHSEGDLLTAYRLPEDTFQRNANTEVTTDVLVIRKRLPGEQPQAFDWRDCVTMTGADQSSMTINGIYTTSRGHVLGHLVSSTKMYGSIRNAVTRKSHGGEEARPLSSWLAEIPARMPEGVHAPMTARDIAATPALAQIDTSQFFDAKSEGAFIRVGTTNDVGVIMNGVPTKIRGLSAADEARIHDYIPLRDAVGALVQAQLDGCGDDALAEMQASLDQHYEHFVRRHGRIAEGRRNKNRRLLQDDPLFDAVHALEVLDDENKFERKAEIFTTRTVGARREIRCDTPMDGLLASIDEFGRVDTAWIAAQVGQSWDECVAQLDGQVYRDPATGEWDIAARYLSGNIRAKLRIAEAAAATNPSLAGNVEALRARLPKWLSRDEITASLGAPWISPEIYRDFVVSVYGRPGSRGDVTVTRASNGGWEVKVPKFYRCEEYDARGMTAAELIDAALNGKAAKVTRPGDGDDSKRVIDDVATAMAIEKQSELKAAFERWVWTDAARAEQLEQIYNETFNATRSADYRGLSVTVPGMTTTRQLRPPQAGGVVRVLLDDNVLLAHPVGFGKTATIAASAVKLRHVFGGKSMIVTPKNVVIQFAGEAKRWFPTARVMVVTSEDLTPSGRHRFWRRVQVTNPDMIITTPEAFKRLRLPLDVERRFLMDEIAGYESALNAAKEEKSNARRVKAMETALAGKVTKLKGMLNIEEKDDERITLADLGITSLFVDEAHRFKALQVDSSEQILGIPSSASQRAFDMLSKVRYLQDSNGKVIFATGSAITNTIAEVYNMQRYLQPDLLSQNGVASFDAWRAQFAETVQSLEPDPAGRGYRIVNRLAEIRNLPELVRMLAQFTDAVADNNAYFDRPTPTFETISVESTELQVAMRESLAERVKLIRVRSEPPKKGDDNILCVLGDARRGALDLRTLYPDLPEDVGGSKLTVVADQVADVYRKTQAERGAQAVFLDIGTPKPASTGGFNAYAALASKLVERGIPSQEIGFIHDAKNDVDKLAMYRRVRSGNLRVIIGSTEKMGEGANIQERLAALHHLNAPYHPGAVTQRNGRIIRNGNLFKDVNIYTYVTKGMLEDWNWHLVTLKAGFITQVMDGMASGNDGEGLARKIVEDRGAMSYDEIEAEASDNPMVRRKCVVDTEVRRLDLLRSAWGQQRSGQRSRLTANENEIERVEKQIALLGKMRADMAEAVAVKPARHAAAKAAATERDASVVAAEAMLNRRATMVPKGEGPTEKEAEPEADGFLMGVGGKDYVTRQDAGLALLIAIARAEKEAYRSIHVLGEIDGLAIVLRHRHTGQSFSACLMLAPKDDPSRSTRLEFDLSTSPVGLVRRIENALLKISDAYDSDQAYHARLKVEIEDLKRALDGTWPHEGRLAELCKEQSAINIELARSNADASGNGIAGFSAMLSKYGVSMKSKAEASDDFDLAATLAELGTLDSAPDAGDADDDDDAPDGGSGGSTKRSRGMAMGG